MKMMMIEAPKCCYSCPCERGGVCLAHSKGIPDVTTRPQWCIDKDVEVEDK